MRYEHIDAERTARLAHDLAGDVHSCLRFVDDFVSACPTRTARVRHAVDRGDFDDALASLLSLSTSSAMVGARSLASAAGNLYAEATRSGTMPARAADRLQRIGAASCVELVHVTTPWRTAA